MSDRANTITVVLEKETRIDELDNIIHSIRMIKGVVTADANVSKETEYWAFEKAKWELQRKLWEVLYTEKS